MILLFSVGCSGGHPSGTDVSHSAWIDPKVNAVSKPATGAGVTAVTALAGGGRLQTVVYDVASGKRLWTRPATMAGRLAGMGVQPPAVLGTPGKVLVAAIEPRRTGRWNATLVVRDARTGRQRWTRPVDTTFGPVRCGTGVCMSEFTARRKARFVALDAATGRVRWHMPGIAEVEWADDTRVVAFRMARHPSLEARDQSSGRTLWSFPVEQAVGEGVNLSGGWAFGALPSGDTLVGYLAPYQRNERHQDQRQDQRQGPRLSAFGFFGVRLADGRQVWARRRLLRVYPSANPAVALIAREVNDADQYGGFAQLDPRTGQTLAQVPADQVPKNAWWLAFPPDLSTLGFLSPGGPGRAYDLRARRAVPASGHRGWSFCTATPAPLEITGHEGFYPTAALCPYDLANGRKLDPFAVPPGWYTGASDGWRIWRSERGALHGVRDARGGSPGMYG